MPTYDVACIARKRGSNKKMNRLVGRIAKDLHKRGGVVRKVEHYGMRPLAYPVRRKGQKHETGRFFRVFVQASPQALRETLQTIRVDEDVIRFKPFKLHPNEMLDLEPRVPFTHKAKISEAHYDALKRSTNIDYYIARTLLLQGKVTREELEALGTHPVNFEPYFRSREEELKDLVFRKEIIDTIQDMEANPDDYETDTSTDAEYNFDKLADFGEGQLAKKSQQTLSNPEFSYIQFSEDEEMQNKAV